MSQQLFVIDTSHKMDSLIGLEAAFIIISFFKMPEKSNFLGTCVLTVSAQQVKNYGALNVFASRRKAQSSLCRLVWRPGDWLLNMNLLASTHCSEQCSQGFTMKWCVLLFWVQINSMHGFVPWCVSDKGARQGFGLDELLRSRLESGAFKSVQKAAYHLCAEHEYDVRIGSASSVCIQSERL